MHFAVTVGDLGKQKSICCFCSKVDQSFFYFLKLREFILKNFKNNKFLSKKEREVISQSQLFVKYQLGKRLSIHLKELRCSVTMFQSFSYTLGVLKTTLVVLVGFYKDKIYSLHLLL